MNENDLSDLSYKELQALAVRYRVPGNIKKHLLVRVLQAIQNGNEQEVNRTLTEVQLTRKKRIKKQKPNAMNVSSTPIHSPNYGFSHDCYYPRHQQPYQWVGAQEEISMREEETMRVPNYQEFRQFLLHRIQRDYPTYNSRENDVTHSSSIVDLRMGAGTSSLQPVIAETINLKSELLIDPNNYVRPSSRSVELQLLTDVNDNSEGPMLLKKMLEAPMGANLGAIASPEPGCQKIWSLEQYPNNNGDLDDSDTLTADSDIENDDTWDNGNNKVTNYYGALMYNNDSNIASRNIQNTGQTRNNYPTGNTDHQYQPGYSVADVESSCQKWIAANSHASRNGNYVESITGNSRGYNSIYYENTAENNSTITRPIDRDRKYYYGEAGNEHLNYGGNETIHHGQHPNWSQNVHQYYEGNHASADAHSGDLYYSQQTNIKHSVGAISQEYYANQGMSQNMQTNDNTCHTIAHPEVPAQICGNVYNKDNAVTFNHNGADNGTAYNTGYYSQYSHENTQQLNDFSNPVNPNKLQQPQQTGTVHESNSRDDKVESSTTQQQSITSGVLDSYCPRLPLNATITSNGQLETILNLNNRVNTDYSKINETSCVYCYSEPIVTQRIEGMHTWCTLKKPLIAEGRQHIFSPNWVVYSDASTGMIMANNEEPSIIDLDTPMSLERSNDGPSISSPDQDSEPRASTESSDDSINDVWIHDYTSYPVSSDNALQSADLTNDETDDDLFSTVSRAAPQNSIDDHTIESFTDLNY